MGGKAEKEVCVCVLVLPLPASMCPTAWLIKKVVLLKPCEESDSIKLILEGPGTDDSPETSFLQSN